MADRIGVYYWKGLFIMNGNMDNIIYEIIQSAWGVCVG